jgi:hypothetical protein
MISILFLLGCVAVMGQEKSPLPDAPKLRQSETQSPSRNGQQHQDPRYFVKAEGGFWKRTGYALSPEFITRGDNGREHFNSSELAGNAVAADISNLYYPAGERSLANTSGKWRQQIVLDAFFNVAKEFWPDVGKNYSNSRADLSAPRNG